MARLTAIVVLAAAVIGISFLAFESAAQDTNSGITSGIAGGIASGQSMMEKERVPGQGMPEPGMLPGNNSRPGLMVVLQKGICPANQTCFVMKNITGACPDGATCYMRDERMRDDHAPPQNLSGTAPAKPDSKNMPQPPGQGANGQSGKPPAMPGGEMDLGLGGQDMMSDMMGMDGMGGMGDQGMAGPAPMGQAPGGGALKGSMDKPGQNITGPGGKPPEIADQGMGPGNETGERFMIFRFAGSCPANQTCFVMENITGSCPDGMSCYKIEEGKPPLNQSSTGQPPAKPNGATGNNWKRE